MNVFPNTSLTLIAKIKKLGPGADSAEWVRFWNSYSLAIRQFAAFKGGEENADDIVMQVLGKLVDVLRSGQYTPEKGKFHSYLATMIVNEVRMSHRKNIARAADRSVSLDSSGSKTDEDENGTLADTLAAPEDSPEQIDEDWRRAVLKSATEHVLTKTAISARDRSVYKAYALEGRDIEDVAREFGISRNLVSQIKIRVDKRIVAFGRSLAGKEMQ
jgi:RNA polymerase sigma factor (sigma-70 family)